MVIALDGMRRRTKHIPTQTSIALLTSLYGAKMMILYEQLDLSLNLILPQLCSPNREPLANFYQYRNAINFTEQLEKCRIRPRFVLCFRPVD